MSTTDNQSWDQWEFDDQLMVTTTSDASFYTRNEYNLIKYPKNGDYYDCIDQSCISEDTLSYCDENAEKKSCDTKLDGGITNGFDAPYVSRLYQLCYDDDSDGDCNYEDSTREPSEAETAELVTDAELCTPDPSIADTAEFVTTVAEKDTEIIENGWQSVHDFKTNKKPMSQFGVNNDELFFDGNFNLNNNNNEETSHSIELNNSAPEQQKHSDHTNEASDGLNDETANFISKQAKLQAEARIAMEQAKQMAKMQMEVEKQKKKKSPIAEFVGIPFPVGKHKLGKHQLSEMRLAPLQVIVNDLHTQIESLNEELVKFLLEREELHVEQDSMLVRVEQLTRFN